LSQALLFLAIHLVGLAVSFAIGPRRAPALCCALAFPIGLATAVIVTLAILLAGLPYTAWTLGGAIGAACAVALVGAVRRGIDRRDLRIAGLWTAAFAIACLTLTRFNVALSTIDSHRILSLAVILSNEGGLSPETAAQLDRQGVFQIIAHSLAGFTRSDFLHGLPLVLGLSFAPMFALTLWHGLGVVGAPIQRRWMAVALVTAALFTISMVDYHILYIHTNLGAGIYLFGYLALFWIAELERDEAWLPTAFLCLIAFALHRTETPLVALLFLVLTVAQSELPRRTLTLWLGLFTAVVAVWYEKLAHHVPTTAFITPARSRLVWILMAGFFCWWLASETRVVRRINGWLPAAVAGLSGLVVAASFAIKPHHMARSTANWAANLTDLPLWGNVWLFLPALMLLGLLGRPPRFRHAFTVGLIAYAALVLVLSFFLANPYRIGLGDSANRMTIHFVPLIFYYLAVKLAPPLFSGAAVEPPGSPTARPEDRPADRST
jgi:hypothetical protein